MDTLSIDHKKTNWVDLPDCDSGDGAAIISSLPNDVLLSISVSSIVKGFDLISKVQNNIHFKLTKYFTIIRNAYLFSCQC